MTSTKSVRHFVKKESGARHNQEFTLLEWYRTGFDQWSLMDDVSDLLEQVLACTHFEHISYRDVFEQHLGFNPHTIDLETLAFEAKQQINIGNAARHKRRLA